MITFGSTPLRAAMAALLAALLAAVIAPPAGAEVIAASVSGLEGGPALASDGRVVVGERRGNGALRIIAVDPQTRAVTELTAFPPLADPRTYPELRLAGTGGIVTASLDVFAQVRSTDAEQAQPIALATRTMTILPTVAPLGSCLPPLRAAFAQLDAAGGEDFVATVGDECGASRRAVRIRTANGTVTIPAAGGTGDAQFPPDIAALRATGPLVSWVETRLDLGSPLTSTLVVARGATGEVLLRVPGGPSQSLAADGTVTGSEFPACSIGVVSPSSPARRRVGISMALCPSPAQVLRGQPVTGLAGGRLVYPTFTGYAVSDLRGGGYALGEATVEALNPSPIAFDGQTLFAVRSDCDADRLLAVDAGVPAPSPGVARIAPERCPVRRTGPGRLRAGRDGRVTIALRCGSGCRGTLRLVQQRRGRRERLAGEADYAGAVNPVLARPLLARYARALAGCPGGLRVQARLHPVGGDHASVSTGRGSGLGSYRITSRSGCRRGGGPAFAAPRPGPRP